MNGSERNLAVITKIVHYKVQRHEVGTVITAPKIFVAAIHTQEPDTFYEADQYENSVSFTHIMEFADEQAEKAHQTAQYTLTFVDVLYPRCDIKPEFTNLQHLASTRI